MNEPTVPAFNIEAEESVLSAMMLSTKAVEAVLPILEPEFFYRRETHGTVFACIRDMYAAGVGIDPVTVADALERREVTKSAGVSELDHVGGKAKIHELAALVSATGNVLHYAEIVVEKWKQREIATALAHAERNAADGLLTADETLTAFERATLDLRSKIDRGKKTIVPLREAAQWFGEKTENPPDDLPGVDGPFRFVRKLIDGRLIVLGGYTADGKSIVAVQSMLSAAKGPSRRPGRARARVGFVTIEMSWQDVIDRIVTTYGVPYRQAQSGRVHGPARDAAVAAISELSTLDVDLIDDESADAAALWRYQRLGRYDFLVIDHLHRIEWEERREIEQTVKAITSLARREEIPILLLSQLSRGGKDFPRPSLASFRESGVIEQEAALACAIWRHRDPAGKPTNDAEFIVLKNRFGRTDSYDLTFDPLAVRYTEPVAA